MKLFSNEISWERNRKKIATMQKKRLAVKRAIRTSISLYRESNENYR